MNKQVKKHIIPNIPDKDLRRIKQFFSIILVKIKKRYK